MLSAMMKGVFRIFSRLMDSMVCGSRLCMRSITRMAMSHRLLPRERRLLKDSCPVQAFSLQQLFASGRLYQLSYICGRLSTMPHANSN